MKDRQLKELWEIRFTNLLKLESSAEFFYGRLLKQNHRLLAETETKGMLDKIYQGKRIRKQMVRELLDLVQSKMVSEAGPEAGLRSHIS